MERGKADEARTSDDDRTTFASNANPGASSGREPVAMMMFLAAIVWAVSVTIRPTASIRPVALTTSTLFLANRPLTPFIKVSAAFRDLACTLA